MKKFCFLSLSIIILCSILSAPPTFPQWKTSIFAEADYQFSAVSDMPLSIRNMPIYGSDLSYVPASNAGPILQESYENNWLYLLGIEVRGEISSDFYFVGKFSLLTLSQDGMAERNYTNDVGGSDRGYGAALTYCELHKGGLIALCGSDEVLGDIVPEIALEKALTDGLSIGVSMTYYVIIATSGWDRWDAYEQDQNMLLAHCLPVTAFIRIGSSEGIVLTAGISFSNFVATSAGKQAGLQQGQTGLVVALTFQ